MQLPLWVIILIVVTIIAISLVFGTKRKGTGPAIDSQGTPSPLELDDNLKSMGAISLLEKPHQFLRQPFVNISNVKISPEGGLLAGSSINGTQFWDAATGGIVNLRSGTSFLPMSGESIYGIDFSSDGRWLAGASDDQYRDHGYLQIWDMQDGSRSVETEVNCIGTIDQLAFSPDDKTIAWRAESSFGLWDPTSQEIKQVNYEGISSLTWLRADDGTLLLATYQDRQTIHLWNPITLDKVSANKLDNDEVYPVNFLGDGAFVAYANIFGMVSIYETLTGKLVQSLEGFSDSVSCVCSDTRLENVFVGGNDGRIQLWRISDNKIVANIAAHASEIQSLECSDSGQVVSIVGTDNSIMWDAKLMPNM